MNREDSMEEQVALFRYGLVADLVHHRADEKSLQELLDARARRSHVIPGSTRTRVAEGTLRDWLKDYKVGGFDALKPHPRRDRGRTVAIPPEAADGLIAAKRGNPALSVRDCIKKVREEKLVDDDVKLAPATVHRLLVRAGVNGPAVESTPTDRRRFSYPNANDLWMSDVMHGPLVGGKKTYLICFLDDATRVIPHAQFTRSENTATFLPVFKQALLRRGVPRRLFVDNGANYRSHALALTCGKLGVSLIHATPYSPESKGKQERFFRTVRASFLAPLGPVTDLDDMNRKLWAYIERDYHTRPHRGLDGISPAQAWGSRAQEVSFLEPGPRVDELFLSTVQRRVNRDRTVSIHGTIYEVEASLVGRQVTLAFDAGRKDSPIRVYDGDRPAGEARLVDLHVNALVARQRTLRLSSHDEG